MHKLSMILCALSFRLAAQWLHYPTPGIPRLPDGKPHLNAPAPRTADAKPDLSGVWITPSEKLEHPILGTIERTPEFLNIDAKLSGGLPLQPWARDLTKARRADYTRNNPISHCLPEGPVMTLTRGYRKIVQTPRLILILKEYNMTYRQIFTDGRPLPPEPQPSWNGYSVGRWYGDTLVVETIGFREGIWIDTGGHPITEAAKVTERFRRINFGRLEIELTVDDPKAFTKPWTVKLEQRLEPDTELLESVCLENEKDLQHYVK
jgi:hypothetical protein